ncbi:LRR receptor-like serine/threonine-protein kinase GSO2 [Forsythia ovata]|uniref:LRR receptor-like serine/threonine-protein kinase GSO2 n=1 Tax=Forsythia ovata TaxID=205694 RepID=A0ABD1VN18_9LAMI
MDKLFFFITMAVLSINCLPHNLTTDQEALVAFKTRIISDPNNILANKWLTNTSICNWIGVSCSRKWQRVTALDFSNFGFSGTIAPHLGNLTFLGYLNITSNNFTGIIPLELSHLRRLKEINMGSNNFTGVVPSWLGTIPEVQHILLDDNSFSGSIPISLLHNNSKLQTLQLADNFLNGNIPQEIRNLSALEYLSLSSNMLTGSIPFGIFNMSSLRKLDLSNNSLSGWLPNDICDGIPELTVVVLKKNQLSGQIPSNIYNCRYLEALSLSYNHFNGSIPSAIGSLNMLQRLYLGENNFIVLSVNCIAHNLSSDQEALVAFKTRIISDPNNILANKWLTNTSICNWIGVSCSTKWQRVTALDFSNFGFSGTIAPHIGNLTFLGYLNISSNNFTGIIPLELSHLRRLKEIDMGSNNFTGVVPSWLGTIPELQHIFLDNNSLSGSIPISLLHNKSKLQTLQLTDNFLNGNIPQEIRNLSTLEYLYLGSNMLTGSIPFGIFNMSSLRELHLTNNSLSGWLPNDICDGIPELTILSLSYNQLSGQIPSNIYNCRYLEVLSLSYNHFNGSIPSAIGSLNMLQALYLGSNNFIGMISFLYNCSRISYISTPSNSCNRPDFLDHLLQLCINGGYDFHHVKPVKQIHAQLLVTASLFSAFLSARLITVYSKISLLSEARKVFTNAPEDCFSNSLFWNSILRANISAFEYSKTLELYFRMCALGFQPDGFGFPLVIRACAMKGGVTLCKIVHCHVLQMGFGNNLHVSNELIC